MRRLWRRRSQSDNHLVEFEHGLSAYTSRGCRCTVCRAAMVTYQREYTKRRAENGGRPLNTAHTTRAHRPVRPRRPASAHKKPSSKPGTSRTRHGTLRWSGPRATRTPRGLWLERRSREMGSVGIAIVGTVWALASGNPLPLTVVVGAFLLAGFRPSCLLCGSRGNHRCILIPSEVRGKAGTRRGRYGSYHYTRFKGGLRDFSFGGNEREEQMVWLCAHDHPPRRKYERGEAMKCARRELRRLQAGRADWRYPFRPKFDVSHLSEQGYRVPLPRDVWNKMVKASSGACFYCSRLATDLEADHVVPVSRGGVSAPWNYVVSCRECNRKKSKRTGREFVLSPTVEQLAKFDEVDAKHRRSRPDPKEVRQLTHEARARRMRLRKSSRIPRSSQPLDWP